MRKLLRIGEVAQLLGVSTKTIRHYHKIALLQEPERTESGYRLYSSQDLMRLQQIRQLQSFGLPLKTIKSVLGEPTREHPLREILQALDQELAVQIGVLEQRRQRIQALLVEDTALDIEQPASAATVAWVKEILGERVAQISPEALQFEANIWAAIKDFHWPAEFNVQVQNIVNQLAGQDKMLEYLLPFYNRVLALESLPEDAVEISQLVEECRQDMDFTALMQQLHELAQQVPALEMPFADVFGELMNATLSPALRRFFVELTQPQSTYQSTIIEA
ncbi:MerR family transcriptional regulator [Dictyobacter kobayashii]|uniref:HTH merR-type domain-containing protein n=1 Tax=Dictyobacter kobayashii TaxID=2014872 RepID=A0A402AIX8_9CHLR|nr:MerR family transcriptional regulator [Dictyobacter kobayashii]GCE19108.1 hypothetical protein KDK_29080 [Dictyobacter kobayashii]